MKKLIATLIMFYAGNVYAQHIKPAPKSFILQKTFPKDIFDTTYKPRLLANGNYAGRLKQDKLPCIIPKPQLPVMPNSYNNEKTELGKILNAWSKKDTIYAR